MLKQITAPFRGFFNARFVALSNSVEALRTEVGGMRADYHTDASGQGVLAQAVSDSVTSQIRESLDGQHSDLLGVAGLLGRSVDQAVDGLTVLLARTDPERSKANDHLAAQVTAAIESALALKFDEATHGTVAELDQMHADIANYATSHRGWASQASLWFNPPISVAHAAGGLHVADINERVAEIPFAYASLAALAPGARVLDVGATESTVAIGLASLGFDVVALDPRPYPLEHQNLTVHIGPIETYEADAPFDAAVLLSSIEHFGLGAYDLPVNPDADVEALARVRELLRPGGTLVLTTPYGDAETTDLQRTYRPEQIDQMLEGWDVHERSYLTRVTPTEWRRVAELTDLQGAHVVLVRATKPEA